MAYTLQFVSALLIPKAPTAASYSCLYASLGSYPANYIMVPETFLMENYRYYPEIVYVYAENSYDIPEIISRLEFTLPDGNNDPNGISLYSCK
mgnify:CR=1 FL=1